MDLGSALLALFTALVVKVAVIITAGWLLVRVYRTSYHPPGHRPWLLLPDEARPEIRVLWWALVLFGVSELTCGVEIYVLFRSSAILSGAHSVSSGLGMALFGLGLYLLLDRRLVDYCGAKCTLNRICKGCTVREPAGCKLRTLVLMAGTFMALAALLPLFVPTARMDADATRWALPFDSVNAWYDQTVVPWLIANVPDYRPSGVAYFLHPTMLFIEFRILPLTALVVACGSLVHARRGDEGRAMEILAASAGMLSYVYFELIVYRATGDVLLGSLAHEVGEYWFLVTTAELLRRTFGAAAPPDAVAGAAQQEE